MKPRIRSMQIHRLSFAFLTRACLLAAFTASAAHAATFTNTGTTGTVNWSTGTNWSGVPVSNLDTILSYTGTLAAGVNVISNNDIASPPFKLNQLSFTNAGPGSGTAPTLTLTGSQLEFITNTALVTPSLIFNTTGTVKPVIDIQNNLLLTNNLGVAATTNGKLSGVISGAGSVAKTGAGTLTLSGNNSYGGGTTVGTGGTLVLTNSSAGGTGNISWAATNATNTLKLDNSGTGQNIVLTNTVTANGGVLVNAAGDNKVTGNLSINSGTSNTYYNVDAGTLELAGNYGAGTTGRNAWFQGAGTGLYSGNLTFGNNNFRKAGTGTWILTGANTYTAWTDVGAGTLIARSSNAFGTSPVTVSANANLSYVAADAAASLNLGATLSITGGTSTTIGGSIGSTTTSARINVAGNATATGTVKVNVFGISGVTPASGTYTLIKGNGVTNTLNGATYSLGTVYNNTNFTVGTPTATTTDLQVPITSQTALPTAFWKGGLTGATNVWAASNGSTQSNWTETSGGGNQPLVPGAGADVTISNSAVTTAPTSTFLGADMTVKSLTIADTVNGLGLGNDFFTLTISPASAGTGITMNSSVPASTINARIKLGAAQTWTNNSGNLLTISGAVTNGANALTVDGTGNTLVSGVFGGGAGGLTKTGAGTLTLSGANTFTGGVTINAGTLQVGNAGALNSTAGSQNTVTFGASSTGTLALAGNSVVVANLQSNATPGTTFVQNANGSAVGNATLTVGNSTNASGTYAGTIQDGTGGGTLALTKAGTGNLKLSGTNTFTGNVSIGVGTLTITNSSALGSGNKNINLTSGGTLALDNTGTGADIVLGSNLAFNGNTIAGATIKNVAGNNSIASSLIISFNATNSFLRSDAGSLTIQGNIGMNGYASYRNLFLQGAGNGSISGNISDTSGNLSITKQDGGTWELSGSNGYGGATTVSAGTLKVNGNISTSFMTTVNSGATLAGSGTVGALTVNSGAFLTPGNSAGILTVDGNYSQAGTLVIEINGLTPGSQHDQVNVDRTAGDASVSLSGSLSVLFAGGSYANGNLLFILLNDASDAITGTFTGLAQNDIVATYGGFDWKISYTADSDGNSFTGGNDVALMAVPEPRAALIGGLGLLALLRRRR